MNTQNRLPRNVRPVQGRAPSRPGGIPGLPQAWARQRETWSQPQQRWAPPRNEVHEGTILPPRSRALSKHRRRGRWLTVGVPTVLGGTLGFTTFLILGVSSLVGGVGLLAPTLAGLGVTAVIGGGSAFLLRNRRPKRVTLSGSSEELTAGTRAVFEKILHATSQQRRRLFRARRHTRGPLLTPVLDRADTLLQRIDGLLASGTLQSRRASDADVLALEGMATRYVPELLDALEETAGILTTVEGDAQRKAMTNLQRIEQQLTTLDARVARIEDDVVSGVTRALDVHQEFLRTRFADDEDGPATGR